MDEYISIGAVLDIVSQYCPDDDGSCSKADVDPREVLDEIEALPVADVQPLSIVAEHVKKRLYETAFNTSEAVARNAIADMAERIDFWIDELKDGDAD